MTDGVLDMLLVLEPVNAVTEELYSQAIEIMAGIPETYLTTDTAMYLDTKVPFLIISPTRSARSPAGYFAIRIEEERYLVDIIAPETSNPALERTYSARGQHGMHPFPWRDVNKRLSEIMNVPPTPSLSSWAKGKI